MPTAPPPPGDNDDDTITPVDINLRRPPVPPSATRRGFGSLEIALAFLAERIRQARQEWDTASQNHRRFLAEKVVAELREWADVGVATADALEAFAAGGPAIADEAPPEMTRCGQCGHLSRVA